uniref:glycerate kinase family protein n=1 Tax=Candidatus Scatomorpha intestinigallinarum TaxID=2840923 RepID=UPI00402A5BAE
MKPGKIVLIPDSFKGTLSSVEVCRVLRGCVERRLPGCEVRAIPVADGGEGSVDAFLAALGGEKVHARVAGPFFEPVESFYGLTDGGKTAIVEMAACAGLPLAGERRDPALTTTYGVGELIALAVEGGARKIILGLGGSATNDAGCGAAAALGVRFFDRTETPFVPTGGTLGEVERIDVSAARERLRGVEITAMCDIDNPMYGENGAAYVFAPQKGAGPEQVRALDAGLRRLAGVMRRELGMDFAELPGAGAAGAMGAGVTAFLGASLQSGIESVLNAVDFDRAAADAELIFTGEGRLDSQSLRGKVVIGVARRAKRLGKRVIAIVGGAEGELEAAYAEGVTAVFTTNRLPEPLSRSAPRAAENLAFTMDNILRLL